MNYDPVRLELVKNAIGSVVDEMTLTVIRVAYSSIMKDTMDLSSAFCDRQGRLIAQGLSLPLHLGSFPDAMSAVLDEFGEDFAPGDVIVLNDPYQGGMHLPDIFVFQPIFIGEVLLGHAVVVAHHNDVGGRVPGSSAADSTEIYQEGLRLPVLKLYEAGRPNTAVLKIIERNVRVPDTVFGDLEAQMAACRIGERGIIALAERYGVAELIRSFDELLAYSGREARRTIRALPDGTYRYKDTIDDDGIDPNTPVTIQVAITIAGDSLEVDFKGTSPQVRGAINSTLSFAKSAVYFAVRAIMDSDAPNNSGFFQPIRVTAPYGCLVNPRPPAAVAARGLSGFRIIDAMFGALAQVAPRSVRAAGEGGTTSYSAACFDSENRLTLFREAVMGAWGAGYEREGVDGVSNPAANISNAPVELIENEAPIMVERYEFVPDSGGAGRWRGGLSIIRQLQFLADRVTLQLRSDRRQHRPYGLFGGAPGMGSMNEIDEGVGWQEAPTKFVRSLPRGARLRHRTAGGGGYGNPFERPAEQVIEDIREGKVTIDGARSAYGVIVLSDPLRVDALATECLRKEAQARIDGRAIL